MTSPPFLAAVILATFCSLLLVLEVIPTPEGIVP